MKNDTPTLDDMNGAQMFAMLSENPDVDEFTTDDIREYMARDDL